MHLSIDDSPPTVTFVPLKLAVPENDLKPVSLAGE
jgi:hypothetical protein